MVSYALIVPQSDCVKEISEVGVCYDAFCNSGPVCNSGSSIVFSDLVHVDDSDAFGITPCCSRSASNSPFWNTNGNVS